MNHGGYGGPLCGPTISAKPIISYVGVGFKPAKKITAEGAKDAEERNFNVPVMRLRVTVYNIAHKGGLKKRIC